MAILVKTGSPTKGEPYAIQLDKAFDDLKAPITTQEEQEAEWASGKSFNQSLTREELEARNMHADE